MGGNKLSTDELSRLLHSAAQEVAVGSRYLHYKQDTAYTVLNLAIQESSDEIVVVYRAEYGEGLTFVRALDSWLETVEQNGSRVPRFRKSND